MDLALFDFDGTITDRETMPDFMHAAVRPGRLVLGKVLLLPLILGYKARLVPGVAVRAAICFFGFWRVPARELEMHGLRFAREFLPSTLRAEAMARIAWHKARGDTVVVVSGGLDAYLRHWCREQGVELLCSTLAQRGGKLTGRYVRRQCAGSEKARLVREHFPPNGFSRIFAYGDTPEDRELLALADEAYYRWQQVPATMSTHMRPGRVIAAFLVAPLAPCLVLAWVGGDAFWFLAVAPFCYLFSAAGIPVFLLFRRLGWLKPWQVVAAGAVLACLLALVEGSGQASIGNALQFAGYGALTALVFWVVAFAGARRNTPVRTPPVRGPA